MLLRSQALPLEAEITFELPGAALSCGAQGSCGWLCPVPWSQAELPTAHTVVSAGLDMENALAAPLGAQAWFERAAGQLGLAVTRFTGDHCEQESAGDLGSLVPIPVITLPGQEMPNKQAALPACLSHAGTGLWSTLGLLSHLGLCPIPGFALLSLQELSPLLPCLQLRQGSGPCLWPGDNL